MPAILWLSCMMYSLRIFWSVICTIVSHHVCVRRVSDYCIWSVCVRRIWSVICTIVCASSSVRPVHHSSIFWSVITTILM